jgi:hypothetical protein
VTQSEFPVILPSLLTLANIFTENVLVMTVARISLTRWKALVVVEWVEECKSILRFLCRCSALKWAVWAAVVVVEEEDFTALEAECPAVWEAVVVEELPKASLGVSLSNDKVTTRRIPFSARITTRLLNKATRKQKTIGQRREISRETKFRIPSYGGHAEWVWDSYSQAFSFLLISWCSFWSLEPGCTFASK